MKKQIVPETGPHEAGSNVMRAPRHGCPALVCSWIPLEPHPSRPTGRQRDTHLKMWWPHVPALMGELCALFRANSLFALSAPCLWFGKGWRVGE